MLRKNPSGHTPVVSTKAYIDPTAVICGRVIIHDYVYVGPYAVIRADELNADGDMDPIIIHSHSNIQDGVVIHSKSGAPVTIGSGTSIAHRAIVHGPVRLTSGYLLDSTVCCLTVIFRRVVLFAIMQLWMALPCLRTPIFHQRNAWGQIPILKVIRKWIPLLYNFQKKSPALMSNWWKVISCCEMNSEYGSAGVVNITPYY